MMELSGPALRVLGCLMEKEMATPDYYPLSMNALISACNQKTNRHPVVHFDEPTVAEALAELKGRQFAWQSDASRVPKFGESFSKTRNLLPAEKAILCLLLVRGAQTVGELRGRSERLYGFAGLEEVEERLGGLAEMGLVMKLPRQSGRKEHRYAHLLGGGPDVAAEEAEVEGVQVSSIAAETGGRLKALEEEVAFLKEELSALREDLLAFKHQFE